MIGQAVALSTRRVLPCTRQVRDAVAGSDADDYTRWTLGIRVGGPPARLISIRS